MIITLLLLFLTLFGVHQIDAQEQLVNAVSLNPYFYLYVAIFLMVVRVFMALSKFFYASQLFYYRVLRLLNSNSGKGPVSNPVPPKSIGKPRQLHTNSNSAAKTNKSNNPLIKAVKTVYQNFVTPMCLTTNKFNDLLSVKARPRLVNACKNATILIGMAITPSRIRIIIVFLRKLSALYNNSGPKGTVLFLKAAAVSLQQSLGGMKISNPREISNATVSLNRKGIPR